MVAFSPDGSSIAVTTTNRRHTKSSIRVWNVAARKFVGAVYDPDSAGVFRLAFSPGGKTLAVGDANAHAYLWDMSWCCWTSIQR